MSFIPLLSPLSLSEHTPKGFRAYICSLYIDPKAGKEPIREVTLRFNKQDNPVLTVRRKPKWVSPAEIDALAEEHNLSKVKIWGWFVTRKIRIVKRINLTKEVLTNA